MAYKFQLGAYTASGSLVQEGAAEVDALTADSLNLQNGGMTNAGALAGATSIDGSGDLTMGTITMTGFAVDADGDTNLKSLAVDNSSTIGCDADLDLMTLAAQSITIAADSAITYKGTAITSTGAELNLLDAAAAKTIVNSIAVIYGSSGEVNATSFELGGQEIVDSSANFAGGNASFGEITASADVLFSGSGGAALETNGAVKFSGVADAVINLPADSFYFKDSDGTMKSDSVADVVGLLAGDGLEQDGASKVLKVKVDASSIEINSDTLRVKAAGITNAMLADDAVGADELASDAVVNASIAANAAIDMDKLDGGSVASALTTLAQADLIYIGDNSDSNNIKKITYTNFEDDIFGNVSGDAAIAAGGALTIASNAVENGMMADDSIGADELIDASIVNAAISNSAAIAATKLDFNVDLGGDITFGNQSDDTISTTGHLTVGGNLTVNGSVTSVNSATINITSSFIFEGPADAHETTLHSGTPSQDITVYLPQYSSSLGGHSAYLPVMADASTAASALVTAAEFALLDGGSSIGTSALAAADGFMHNDGGTMKHTTIEKIGDFLGGGAGLLVSSGVLSVNIDTLGALSSVGNIHQTDDHFLISDAGTEKKITFSDLEDEIFGNISGDAAVAAGGALTIAATSVEGSMLNNNIVSGLTDIGAAIVATDEMIISDAGTIRRTDMSRVATYIGSSLAVDVQNVAAAGTLAVGINYFSDMSSDGEDAVTLPASPTVGQSVKVKAPSDCSAARYITINKAGSQTIDGQASIRLESPFAAVDLVYVAADLWRVF